MESFVFIIIGAVLFAQGWNLIRVVDLRTVGFLAAVGAIGILGVATIGDIPASSDGVATSVVITMSVLLAVYAAVLAAVGLWDFDARTLGLYSIFLAVVILAIGGGVYLGAIEDANEVVSDPETIIGVGAIVLAILFGLLFINLVPPLRRTYQTVTGYAVLVGASVVAVLGLVDFLEIV